MDCAAYPVIRFPARRVAGLLNGASANTRISKETRNSDGLDTIGFDTDGKPGLLTERGEAVLYETCSGSTEKLVPSLTLTSLPGRRTPPLPFKSSS